MKKEIMQKLKCHFADFDKNVSINNIKMLSPEFKSKIKR